MVRSGLSETEEAEAFAWDLGNLEVLSRVPVVQVVVVCSTINFRPRGPVIRNFHDPRLEMRLSRTTSIRPH